MSSSKFSRRFVFSALSLLVIATVFYKVQNTGQLDGGEIAPVKLLWLFYAIYMWFVIPFLIATHAVAAVVWRRVFAVFFINMLIRGCTELYMMYVLANWSPYYGIAADAFSILLLLSILTFYGKILPRDVFYVFTCVLITTLFIEIGFVFYMLGSTDSSSIVYFVSNNAMHSKALSTTWWVVSVLTLYLFYFYRRLAHGVTPGPDTKT